MDDQTRGSSRAQPADGFFELGAVLTFLLKKSAMIVAIAAATAILCFVALFLIRFPYSASAIVFIDPRDERVTLQEEVLPAIGTDAAVLESMVQIVNSDGFLIGLMEKLGLLPGASQWTGTEEQAKQLAKLRKKITIERMGATYLVTISYRGDSGEEAARIANEIATAFVESQNGLRRDATTNASRSLSERLVELRAKLNESEAAISRFKADNNIVFIDDRNTIQMRQLSDISQQLALIKNTAEEAEARYGEGLANGTFTRSATQGNDESEQLSFLRKQRTQLVQTRDQQIQIYGPRHPRLVETQQMIDGIDRQIAQQRQLLVGQLKSERDINVSKQAQLERQIQTLSTNITQSDAAKVQLASLEREAAANRDLYQQFLSRNKATSELALQPRDNVRIVSPAIAPLVSTRPPMVLLVPVIGFFGLAFAVVLMVLLNLKRLKRTNRDNPIKASLSDPDDEQVAFARPRQASPHAGSGSLLSLIDDDPPRSYQSSRRN